VSATRQRFSLARHRMRGGDFSRAYAAGGRAHGSGLTLVVHETGLPVARLGLSVSKKRARRAVQRNRIRRLFREAFRLELAGLPPGLDVVMIATRGEGFDLARVRAELARLVPRARDKARRKAAAGGPP
jgi:ribonuclease P protein component